MGHGEAPGFQTVLLQPSEAQLSLLHRGGGGWLSAICFDRLGRILRTFVTHTSSQWVGISMSLA